jgi:hypothetical protein
MCKDLRCFGQKCGLLVMVCQGENKAPLPIESVVDSISTDKC